MAHELGLQPQSARTLPYPVVPLLQRAGAAPVREVTHGAPGSSRKAAHRTPNPALGAAFWARRAQTRHIVPATPTPQNQRRLRSDLSKSSAALPSAAPPSRTLS